MFLGARAFGLIAAGVGLAAALSGCGAASDPFPDTASATGLASPAADFAIVGTPVPNPTDLRDPFKPYAKWSANGMLIGVGGGGSCYPAPRSVTMNGPRQIVFEFVDPTMIDGNTAHPVPVGTACTADFVLRSYLFSDLPIPRGSSADVIVRIKHREPPDVITEFHLS